MESIKIVANKLLKRTLGLTGKYYLTSSLGSKVLRRHLPQVEFHGLQLCSDDILIIAPHPGDEVLGCGLLLDDVRNKNKRLTIAYFTSGEDDTDMGRKAARATATRFGAEPVFMEFVAGQLKYTSNLMEAVNELLLKIKPSAVVVPVFTDYHLDHRALFSAVVASQYKASEYLLYSTFSPLFPVSEMTLSMLGGSEDRVRSNLVDYEDILDKDKMESFMTLRRATARAYMNTKSVWEPYLLVKCEHIETVSQVARSWPQVYPMLTRNCDFREFLDYLDHVVL